MVQGLTLTSRSFKDQSRLSNDYIYSKCGGDNRSPQFSWHGEPAGTRSFALVCQDPDAPGNKKPFIHWIIYDIPATIHEISAGIAKDAHAEGYGGAMQGTNDFGLIGYDGPCPPPGNGVHHYIFKLYALDASLGLSAGATKKTFEAALAQHILATAEIVGLYER